MRTVALSPPEFLIVGYGTIVPLNLIAPDERDCADMNAKVFPRRMHTYSDVRMFWNGVEIPCADAMVEFGA